MTVGNAPRSVCLGIIRLVKEMYYNLIHLRKTAYYVGMINF